MTPGGPRLAAFQHPTFTFYWCSQISTNIGSWMQQVATGWLVLQLTNSPAYLGFNALMQGVPLILFALAGGVVADRFDRFRLMVWSSVVQIIPDSALALLVISGGIRVEHVLIYSLVSAAISGLSNPSRQAFVPNLVPKSALLSALALNSMVWQGTAIIGPTFAGLALAFWGLPASFNLNVLSDIVSLALLLCVHVPQIKLEAPGTSGWHGVRDGLAYGWNEPHVRMLLVAMAVMTFLARPYTQLMPVFARDVFRVGPEGLGVMLTMPAVGTIAAAFVLATMGRIRLVRAYLVTSAVLSLALIGFTVTRSFPMALAFLFVVGGTISAASTVINTRLQEIVEERMRGRVMSLYMASNQGSWRLGATPAGIIADAAGAPLAIGLGAGILLVALAGLARSRSFWESESFQIPGIEPAPREPPEPAAHGALLTAEEAVSG